MKFAVYRCAEYQYITIKVTKNKEKKPTWENVKYGDCCSSGGGRAGCPLILRLVV